MTDIIYNFIIPSTSDLSLEQLASSGFSCPSNYANQGEFIWGHQTYHILKSHGFSAQLSYDLNPNAVNLAHGNVLRSLDKRPDCFCVSLQADFPHYPLAHFHVVQNMEQEEKNAAYITHWPQPEQLPRDASHEGPFHVVYQGARNFTELDEERINTDLRDCGIHFSIYDQHQWQDLSEVDILIGIRSFGHKQYKRKPPTKLINAWHAGIPFIGGWDSAYSQVGTPGKDYIRVASYQQMIDEIKKLKADSGHYNDLIKEGQIRASAFTVDAIAKVWIGVLENRIDKEFELWVENPRHELAYHLMRINYGIETVFKNGLKKLYRIPGINRLRDRYYDPLK